MNASMLKNLILYRLGPEWPQTAGQFAEALATEPFAELEIVEIPDGVAWQIAEYDGFEHVAGKHRTWGAGH